MCHYFFRMLHLYYKSIIKILYELWEDAMGKFLTALHVKTTGKEQFIEKFTQLMKKDGYVPCSEDEAAISYAAVFEGGWRYDTTGLFVLCIGTAEV